MASKLFLSFLILTQIVSAQYTEQVDPFIGTGGHGHTFPGPCYPFGMVQLGPDTRLEGWDGCSGYHYSDSLIYGFSHTHLSGTGVPDYCDILVMPGNKKLVKSDLQKKYFPSKFEKQNEFATPGKYQVYLNDPAVQVRLTTTLRTGMHEYIFSDSSMNWIVIDLLHRDKVLNAGFDEINKQQISGHRISSSWAKEQSIFFSMKFSQAASQFIYSSDSLRLFCVFKNLQNKKLILQCAISSVDIQGAKNNLSAEWMNFQFDKARINCSKEWNKMLSRIEIKDTAIEARQQKKIFYTSLYHTLIHPSLHQDADLRYRGMDNKIHKGSKENPRYTVFSLWDTYRAVHPLYQLIYPEYNYKFAKTFLEQYKECGRLPVWELASYETYCMIGNHSIPVLVNAYVNRSKKFSFDSSEVVAAILGTLQKNYSNLEEFRKGYISMEHGSESVSKTIENATDYYALNLIHNTDRYEQKYYQNLYNPETGFYQAKQNGSFTRIFDPYEVNFNYTEANAWQYLFGAHHDIEGMMECFNRDEKSINFPKTKYPKHAIEIKLDSLFGAKNVTTGREQPDITGLIGQYAHGNEPSHHIAYLYNYCNRNDKTQRRVKQIIKNFYTDKPDGLCGNEDCGQMSAWYVFSALGFYPVNPVLSTFQSGFPQFNQAILNIPGKKKINIERVQYVKNYLVSNLTINDSEIQNEFSLTGGDKIKFYFDSKKYLQLIPKEISEKETYVPLPYLRHSEQVFDDSTWLDIISFSKEGIEYSTDSNFKKRYLYKKPVVIKSPITYYFRNTPTSNWASNSMIQKAVFTKKPVGFYHYIETPYDAQYSAGGSKALFDGLSGSLDFRDGRWQGYWGKDVIIQLKIINPEKIQGLKIRCLQDQNSWIILPSVIKVFVSNDGYNYNMIELLSHSKDKNTDKSIDHTFITEKIQGYKFIELKIINSGALPSWHLSSGSNSWIFIDEIRVY